MNTTYSIRMTRGVYVVDEADALKVLNAITNHETLVLVKADTLGDGLYRCPVNIVTAHIMSVAENIPMSDDTVPRDRPQLRSLPDPT